MFEVALCEQSQNSPIFVVGAPRSGTTLCAKILGSHSSIFMPGETHYFPDIYAQRKELGELNTPEAKQRVYDRLRTLYARYNEPGDQERIDNLIHANDAAEQKEIVLDSYKQAFVSFMEMQAKSVGKIRWGNNVPKDIFFVEDLLGFFPDAKIVVCVRDVRDFLYSYRDKWTATSSNHIERIKALYHPVVTSLLWKSSVKRMMLLSRKLPSKRIYIVKYEDLVTNTAEVVESVCKFIDESFEERMLDIEFSNSSDGSGRGGVYTTSLGKWKSRLSSEEVWCAQWINKKEMREFGYITEAQKTNPLALARILMSTPFGLLRGLKANKQNTGPLIPYIIKRIAGLFENDAH